MELEHDNAIEKLRTEYDDHLDDMKSDHNMKIKHLAKEFNVKIGEKDREFQNTFSSAVGAYLVVSLLYKTIILKWFNLDCLLLLVIHEAIDVFES